MENKTVHIIGAGLCGLTLAYLLQQKGITIKIFEANDRIGGRILTHKTQNSGTIEMGATWCNDQHPSVLALVKELNGSYFNQFSKGFGLYEMSNYEEPHHFSIPDDEPSSYRIEGGTDFLIQQLVQKLKKGTVYLEQKVNRIQLDVHQISLTTHTGNTYHSDYIVSTIPPNLLCKTIQFEPELPSALATVAEKTHTWMGESIKFALEYQRPFWREKNLSGTLFSTVNIVQEMYDHSANQDSFYALKGFLNSKAFSLSLEERKKAILEQLQRLMGDDVLNYIQYHEKIWQKDSSTFAPYDSVVVPHQYNGHPIYKTPIFENKLFLSGSETAPKHPGYMEGAIQAAKYINSFF